MERRQGSLYSQQTLQARSDQDNPYFSGQPSTVHDQQHIQITNVMSRGNTEEKSMSNYHIDEETKRN